MDKELLATLANNPLLFEAVKTHVLSHFNIEDINDNLLVASSNELLGQMARSILDGKANVEDAFQEIANLRVLKDKPSEPNPGR